MKSFHKNEKYENLPIWQHFDKKRLRHVFKKMIKT